MSQGGVRQDRQTILPDVFEGGVSRTSQSIGRSEMRSWLSPSLPHQGIRSALAGLSGYARINTEGKGAGTFLPVIRRTQL